jgi:hypothetical protein
MVPTAIDKKDKETSQVDRVSHRLHQYNSLIPFLPFPYFELRIPFSFSLVLTKLSIAYLRITTTLQECETNLRFPLRRLRRIPSSWI